MFNGSSGEEALLKSLEAAIAPSLLSAGLLFRLFGRVKTIDSIKRKDKLKGYSGSDRKMQDLFGIRIVLYFSDDEDIASSIITDKFQQISSASQVDSPAENHFGVRRNNFILQLPDDIVKASRVLADHSFIDPTFEVQLRTVLSEGWHEIDHDLRYKCKADWDGHTDLGRGLNGLAATLETCDWAATQMFDELAWRHYRASRWQACFRTKFRLRFQDGDLTTDMCDALSNDVESAKALFRTSRSDVIAVFWRAKVPIPVTLMNALMIANRVTKASQRLYELEPSPIRDWLDQNSKQW